MTMVYLGTPGDLRAYTVSRRGNTLSYSHGQANPFAPRLTSGSEYDEIDAWDEWEMSSWQAGHGRKDPRSGGFLYAEVDTRFPNQFMLGPWAKTYTSREYEPAISANVTHTYNNSGTIAWRLTDNEAPTGGTISDMWVYMLSTSNQLLTATLRDDTSGTPHTIKNTTSTQWSNDLLPAWVRFSLNGTVDNDNFITIETGNTEFPLVSNATSLYEKGTAGWDVDTSGTAYAISAIADSPTKSSSPDLHKIAINNSTSTLMGVSHSAGAHNGGHIWRSTNNAITWGTVSGNQTHSGFGDIALGASNVWCAVADGWTTTNDTAIWRSTDDGATWGTVRSGSLTTTVLSPASPSAFIDTDGTAVWCAAFMDNGSKIFRSTDNGATWSEAKDLSNNQVSQKPLHYAGGSVWYALVSDSSAGITTWKSTDNGATWGTVGSVWGSVEVATWGGNALYTYNGNLYSNVTSTLSKGLWKSSDGGTTFAKTSVTGIQKSHVIGTADVFYVDTSGTAYYASDGETYTTFSSGEISDTVLNATGAWNNQISVGYVSSRDSVLKIITSASSSIPAHFFSNDGISSTDTTTVRLVKYNSNMYMFNESNMYKFDSVNNKWGAANAIGVAGVTDAIEWGGSVWIACGGNDLQTMGTAETFTDRVGENATVLSRGVGRYLWRAYENNMIYWDGSVWAGTVQVGPSDNFVRGMAGMGGTVYMSTDDGLWYVNTADTAYGITEWGKYDATNGRLMSEYQGALYIPVGQDLLRYDESGAIGNVGLNRQEGLPNNRQGKVYCMVGLNNWLLAAVAHTASDGSSSVWAYSGEGWHHIATLPEGMKVRHMIEERDENYLWVAAATTDRIFTFRYALPNDLTNPAKDARADYVFAPYGWLETDKFFGGQKKLDKDWESVYITGLNLSANQKARLYWKDPDSTAWEALGTVTADNTEVRWTSYTTRPNSKWIKLGVLLESVSSSTSPIVEASVVKFLPTVNDRSRWELQLDVHDNREVPGGSVDTTAGTAQLSHLNSLAENRTHPVIFQDLDGTQYETKVIDHRRSVARYDWIGGAAVMDWTYTLVLEAVTSGAYN